MLSPTLGVLLADDDPLVRAGLRTILSAADDLRVVGEAGDGAAAIAGVAAYRPDVVLMDVRMPGLGGLEAARRLRAQGLETPIIALTANAFDDDRRACLDAGMDDFLVKPLSLDALRGALARWTGAGWTRQRRRAKVAS